ncbi:hypothetical protein DW966_13695 [Bacteroides stercoris]|nr:hypothetical protein DW966_13695 [Bacteroides stercoris]
MLKQRDKNIDIAKGLGIFLVVWGHTSATPEWISAFHMPLFFFLSGIFFRPNPNWCQFLKSKSRRLLVPYIIYFICVTFSMEYYTCYVTNHLTGVIDYYSFGLLALWLVLFGSY